MKTCQACRKRVNVRATKCPYCQTAYDHAEMEGGRKEYARNLMATAFLLITGVAGFIYWLSQPETMAGLVRLTSP